MQGNSPLQPVPVLKELLGALALCDAILNVCIAVDHFSDLHCQVIFVLDIGTDGDSRSDAYRRCWDMRD